MSSFSTQGQPIHLSVTPLFREHTTGVMSSESGCLTHNHVQMYDSELDLMELSDVEHTHLQQLMRADVEVEAGSPEDAPHPAPVVVREASGCTTMSPLTDAQAVDLSRCSEEHCVVTAGEKTPPYWGEVPDIVPARGRDVDSATSSLMLSRSAVRVCLAKMFQAKSAVTPSQQDTWSAVPSNLLKLPQQSAEPQETVLHPPETSISFEEAINHSPHMAEPKHGVTKSFSFDYHQEMVARRAHYTGNNDSAEEQQSVKTQNDEATSAAYSRYLDSTHSCQPIQPGPDSTGKSESNTSIRAHSRMPLSQRRALHNNRERERRKRIRSCCDELNRLVPFCDSDSDKATTLRWTTAFLRYINNTYGDLREEFEKTVLEGAGFFLDSSSSSGQNRI